MRVRSKNSPVSRATTIPVVRTAGERTADEAAGRDLLAFTRPLWESSRLALLTLIVGIISGFLAPAAGELTEREAALRGAGQRPASDPAELTQSVVSFDTVLMALERGTTPSLGVEFEVAEFEQEDDEEHSKGVAAGAPRAAVRVFPRTADERFRQAVFAFVSRIGDVRDLPRGPPSLA